jgi:radical SAM superfamily enzyme
LEPIKECVKTEEVMPVDGQDRIILATMYKMNPSKLNGRQRLLLIQEDVTAKRKMERKLETKRKKIEKMDEFSKTLMAFYEHSPMHMSSIRIREDDIELRLINPAKLNWLEKYIPHIRETYKEKGWLTGSKKLYNNHAYTLLSFRRNRTL